MKKALCILAVVVCITNLLPAAQITTTPRAAQPAAKQVQPPMGAMVLPKTDIQKREFSQWQRLYGFNEDSHIYYNLAVLLKIADQHGLMINSDRQYINMIFNDKDPNSLASLVVDHDNAITELMKENTELKKRLDELEAKDPNELSVDAALIRGVLDRLNRLETAKMEQESRTLALEMRIAKLENIPLLDVSDVVPMEFSQPVKVESNFVLLNDPNE